ncbi:MAG: 2-dehydropantoate 2-reductase [Deltaproteobacteria bacterium]|nr:2-dehydropantoate 2-reductase [Deltaproteobacteria bacterium]
MAHAFGKVVVVGAGAIGGLTAGYLQLGGCPVELVAKHQGIVDLARDPGLELSGVKGKTVVPVAAVAQIAQLTGPLDLVFLATKATDLLAAARGLLPLLAPDALVVSLQNGLCEEALAKVVGRQRVVGCVVGFGATMHGPARLEMTSGGEFVIGSLDPPADPRLEALRGLMSHVVPTRVSGNILGELFAKLIINSCITSLGALCGLTLGRMLALAPARKLYLSIMREAMGVAEAMGIKVEAGAGGKLDYYKYLEGNRGLDELKRHLVLRLVGFKYRRLKSSSLQSLERGRPTEIEYFNGYLAQKARDLGVPSPVNRAVTRLIKEIEAGTRAIGPANFTDPSLKGW